jgi:hypothetical protein
MAYYAHETRLEWRYSHMKRQHLAQSLCWKVSWREKHYKGQYDDTHHVKQLTFYCK